MNLINFVANEIELDAEKNQIHNKLQSIDTHWIESATFCRLSSLAFLHLNNNMLLTLNRSFVFFGFNQFRIVVYLANIYMLEVSTQFTLQMCIVKHWMASRLNEKNVYYYLFVSTKGSQEEVVAVRSQFSASSSSR